VDFDPDYTTTFGGEDIKDITYTEVKRKLALLTIFLLMSILASSGTYWLLYKEESVRTATSGSFPDANSAQICQD